MAGDKTPDAAVNASWPVCDFGRRGAATESLPANRFVVFGGDRCGKSILLELLGQYGQVKCDRNLLAKHCFFPLWHLHRQAAQSQADLYGFQLSSQDVLVSQRLREPSRFLQLLHHQGYRILHLHRHNMMRHAVALLKAQQLTDTHTHKRQPITITPSMLFEQLAQLEKQRLEAATLLDTVPHLRITYERDLLDPNHHGQTIQRLSDFFNADWQSQPRPRLRLVHQQIADLIANYDEVRQALEQSDYAYVLSQQSMQFAL